MMKFLFYILIFLGSLSLRAGADLKGKPPEEFDWLEYVSKGNSTGEETVRAQEGSEVLKQRIDALYAEYRRRLVLRHNDEDVRLLDEMQAHWRQSADAEVALIGGAWMGGSGAKAEFPKARLHCYLRRVIELKEIQARCLSLNE
jgi:hypothetical protein